MTFILLHMSKGFVQKGKDRISKIEMYSRLPYVSRSATDELYPLKEIRLTFVCLQVKKLGRLIKSLKPTVS